MAKTEKTLMSYSSEHLWADSCGDREPTFDAPPDERAKWNNQAATILNRDGTTSTFRMLQPSRPRVEELAFPWDEDAVVSTRTLVTRDVGVEGDPQGRPRFDANPTTKPYLDANPLQVMSR